jgi:hypothetical protein
MPVVHNKNPSRSPLRNGFSYWSPTYVFTGATLLKDEGGSMKEDAKTLTLDNFSV